MTGVTVLFYGRRARASRTASDSGDLGFISSSDRTNNSSSAHRHRSGSREAVSASTCGRFDRHRIHLRSDEHGRENRNASLPEFDELGPCSEVTVPESGPIQLHGGVNEAPIQNIVPEDILNCVRGRFDSNERLPRSVLLAKERLLQRLRGSSGSCVRQSHESRLGTHYDNFWLNNSGNQQTNTSSEQLAETGFITHSTQASRQLQETVSNPPPPSREAPASFQHEVFTEVKETDGSAKSSVSDECSICLEKFAEGTELVGLPCGHIFHSSCLCPWIQTCRKCPYCRSGISSH